MRRLLATFTAIALLAGTLAAESRLPVKRVVLYKNGVGYFEHTARITGNGEITIDFTSAQLNDALKSLTVLDLSGGQISGVSYNSTAPLRERLKALRLPVDENTSFPQMLGALRGARVAVRGGTGEFIGRILGVEERTRVVKDATVTVFVLSAVSDAGEIRSFDLSPEVGVRLLDRDLSDEVGRYLGLLASTRDRDVRRMRIAASGNGERQIFASYISEVPVWKSTYRVVVPAKAGDKAILQGWAIVDNTVGEDWTNVELSLVAGAPQSFIQELSQPLYARRPVMQLPQYASLTPQTHEETVAMEKAEEGGVVGGIIGSPPMPAPAPPRATGEMRFKAEARQSVADAAAAMVVNAATRELGDLFEYKLTQPVTIATNQSALVPILNAKVDAETVTLWNEQSRRPLRALWLTNSSGLTLDAGTFNILEANTFAGEGLMEVVKPGEKRLLSYAVDQGVRVEWKFDAMRDLRRRARIVRGLLLREVEQLEKRTYTLRNDNNDTRTVVVEHPQRANFKFTDASAKPAETTANLHRFRTEVKPHATASFTVEELQSLSHTYALTNIAANEIVSFLESKEADPKTEAALRTVLAKKNALAAIETQLGASRARISEITADQQRLRENMKALKGSPEEKALLARYTRQLNAQEDEMELTRRRVADLLTKREEAQSDLNKTVEGLTVD